jgi:hypothetical protein
MVWLKSRINRMQLGETVMSWLGKLEKAKVEMAARNVDPWRFPLERVRGKIDYDGIERVTTQMLLDVLEVPQCRRRAGTYRKLSKLMVELGWTPVRVRARTRGDYLEQVRGYARDVRCSSTVPNRERATSGSAPV